MMYIICILCVGVCLLHVIHVGKEDTFLQAYVASNLVTRFLSSLLFLLFLPHFFFLLLGILSRLDFGGKSF